MKESEKGILSLKVEVDVHNSTVSFLGLQDWILNLLVEEMEG